MIYVAIMGLGTVGGGVADVLLSNAASIAKKTGEELRIKYILDIRDLSAHPLHALVVNDINIILQDPEVSIVAELMGGSHPAFDFSKACLEAGKHVVTSNKEVVANFGDELLRTAAAHGVKYYFEASVGGGIPVIKPISLCLGANRIQSVCGILNGTTNYILTRMYNGGCAYADALAEAQAKGYAEKNPAADVEGMDTTRKIAILAALSFGGLYAPDDIPTTGISGITGTDIEMARMMGGEVRLIGLCRKEGEKTVILTAPFVVPGENPLCTVSDVFNAVVVTGDAVGDVMFYGRGAGNLPTASAVVADMIDVALHGDDQSRISFEKADSATLADIDTVPFRFAVYCPATAMCELPGGLADGFSAALGDGCCFMTKPMTTVALREAMRETGTYRTLRIL